MSKKMKKIKNCKEKNNSMTKEEFKELLAGLTDEEISQAYDWLLDQRQNL